MATGEEYISQTIISAIVLAGACTSANGGTGGNDSEIIVDDFFRRPTTPLATVSPHTT